MTTIGKFMDCQHAGCSNAGRYIDEHGLICCATCPLKHGVDSIKISDVPKLLAWCREVLAGGVMGGSSFSELSSIIGRKP